MTEKNNGIRGLLDPDYKTNEDIANEKRDKFFKEVVEPSLQGKRSIEPIEYPEEKPLEDYLMETPMKIDVSSIEPVKKTTFTDKEFENYVVKDAKKREQVRKFRQDPKWVADYNQRFPKHKTTLLPKDKPFKYVGFGDKDVERLEGGKKKMDIVSYVNKMNNLYSTNVEPENDKTIQQLTKLRDQEKERKEKWYDKMAKEEADHLNEIKRENWNSGGRVGAEPKYVSAQDVVNVYEPKETPVKLKGLHQKLKTHNEESKEKERELKQPGRKNDQHL